MARPKTVIQIQPVQKRWLSKEEAKKYLGCSDELLQKLRNEAQVTFARYGTKMYWYELSSIDRFLQRHVEGVQV